MLRFLTDLKEKLLCQTFYQPNSRQIKSIIKLIPEVAKVRSTRTGDIEIRIKNFTDANLLLKITNNANLIFVAIFEIPNQFEIETFVATIIWNDNKAISHNTFAYMTLKSKCVLESHLSFQGGVTKDHLQYWAQNFVSKIPHFQETLKITIQKSAGNTYYENCTFNTDKQERSFGVAIEFVEAIPSVIKIIANLIND